MPDTGWVTSFNPFHILKVTSPRSTRDPEAQREVWSAGPGCTAGRRRSCSLVASTPLTPSLLSCSLFKAHPETLEKFDKFKNLKSEEEMKSSEDLKKHGCTVLTALGTILKKKGQHAAEIQPLAQSHATKHKIPVKYLEVGGHSRRSCHAHGQR